MEEPSQSLGATAPTQSPPEVQVLLEAQELLVPVLIWCSRACHINPCPIPSEYGYTCLGYFFISELRVRAGWSSLICLC